MKRLLVFLRAPEPGAVKTRLAERLGATAACGIYEACVELTLDRLAPLRCETILCVDSSQAIGRIRAWLGSAWTVWPQEGDTLGARLAHATDRAFTDGATQVVVIGTDSPWIRTGDILRAFHALEEADVVLGPTEDGGYYLLGLRRPMPTLFEGMAWGTEAVYDDTRMKVYEQGAQLHALPVRYDLDHVTDVERFVADERRQRADSPALARMAALMEGRSPCPS